MDVTAATDDQQTATAPHALVSPGAIGAVLVSQNHVTATVRLIDDDPAFSGPLSGCSLLPGGYLIEFTRQAVQEAFCSDRPATLAEVESCRFRRPVLPGETVSIDVSAHAHGNDIRCRAQVSVSGALVATMRLRCQCGAPS
ncbi:MAG: hypothetical protein JO345_06155 [Streptosporangiaceae bacterium]|nr:hypothetical protein [Streptosporangiaceae bacterium]